MEIAHIPPQEHASFENKMERIVHSCIDLRLRKLSYSIWVMISGGVGSLVFFGVQWGTIRAEQKHNTEDDLAHRANGQLHVTTDDRLNVFVTRAEWAATIKERDRALDLMQATMARMESKIDDLSRKTQ